MQEQCKNLVTAYIIMVGVLAGFLSCHFGTGQVAAERREKNAPNTMRYAAPRWRNDAQTERIGTDRSEVNLQACPATRRPPLAMVLRCGRSIPAAAPAN
jgi:hypothetical protein